MCQQYVSTICVNNMCQQYVPKKHSQGGQSMLSRFVTQPIVGENETEFGEKMDELIFYSYDELKEYDLWMFEGHIFPVRFLFIFFSFHRFFV